MLSLLTAFGIVLTDVCFPCPDFAILSSVFFSFFGAIPNVIFVLLLNLINYKYKIFYSYKWMAVEIILFIATSKAIIYFESLLPYQYLFVENASAVSRRFFFTFEFNQLYVFIFLYFALFLIKYWLITSQNSRAQ